MPAKKTEAAARGLRLTLPGAPATWHHLPDHGVWAHPVHATPTGEPGEPTREAAEAMAADPGCPVELVDIPDVDAARVELGNHIRVLRGLQPVEGLPRAGAGAEGAVLDEQTATTKEA